AHARRHWRAAGRLAAGAPFDELESLVVDGHPYHPSYKSRLGFDAADNAEFGPEFGRLLRPEWVAVRADLVEGSALGGVPPATVATAPRTSGGLQSIAARDPYWGRGLRPVLLGELRGVAHSPELAAIWRDSLHRHLAPGEDGAPFTALCHVDATGQAFITPWVKEQGVEPWVRRVLEMTVPPVLHFLVAHGIALEAHAQNLILIQEDGRPRRLALRDFHDG